MTEKATTGGHSSGKLALYSLLPTLKPSIPQCNTAAIPSIIQPRKPVRELWLGLIAAGVSLITELRFM